MGGTTAIRVTVETLGRTLGEVVGILSLASAGGRSRRGIGHLRERRTIGASAGRVGGVAP